MLLLLYIYFNVIPPFTLFSFFFNYNLPGIISQSDNRESGRQAKCQTVGFSNGMSQVSLRDRQTLQGLP